ncbi:MAG: cupredoxin family copper-binding protein [Rhizobiaceae bacterium]|nr:cupredoxin family copper-binding protein [Rhizobiaceae bacterium]
MSVRNRRSVLAGGVAAFAAALSGVRVVRGHDGEDHGAEGAVHHLVTIERFKFEPAELSVSVGDTITWTNADIAPHTATAEDGNWDTGTIKKGEAISITVAPGMTGGYFCRFHPAMKAELEIDA